ncbi:MAG: hypothetical protein CMP14_02645 [Rickettsiales bacterium]|nr:hypothetical protein [Rickettsiales bacterium]
MKSTVYAGAANWSAADSKDHRFGLFRLKSGTTSWENITNSGLPDKCEIRAVVVDPRNTNRVFVGTQVGPYVSEDGGDNWTALTLPSDNAVTWSILLHPDDPDIVYAGTQDQGIFRTSNSGKSWDELEVPEPNGLCRMGFPSRTVRMCLDPSNPDEVYAGVEVGGLVRSLDAGETWEDIGGGLLELAKKEHLKSQIGSNTKTEGMMDTHATTISASRPGTLIHATRMGLFRSDDKGETWNEMGIGKHSPLTYARDVQVSVHDPDTLYAALSVAAVSDTGSLYRSKDFGESWSRFDVDVSVESTMMHIGQSAKSPDCVFAGARRGQVFGTEDGGNSWTQMELPGGVQGVYSVACA